MSRGALSRSFRCGSGARWCRRACVAGRRLSCSYCACCRRAGARALGSQATPLAQWTRSPYTSAASRQVAGPRRGHYDSRRRTFPCLTSASSSRAPPPSGWTRRARSSRPARGERRADRRRVAGRGRRPRAPGDARPPAPPSASTGASLAAARRARGRRRAGARGCRAVDARSAARRWRRASCFEALRDGRAALLRAGGALSRLRARGRRHHRRAAARPRRAGRVRRATRGRPERRGRRRAAGAVRGGAGRGRARRSSRRSCDLATRTLSGARAAADRAVPLVLLDVPVHSAAESAFVQALVARARRPCSPPSPAGDERPLVALDGIRRPARARGAPRAPVHRLCPPARAISSRRGRRRSGATGRGGLLLGARRGTRGGRDRPARARGGPRGHAVRPDGDPAPRAARSMEPARDRAARAPACPRSSRGARGGRIRPAARSWPCSSARSRSSPRGASPSTSRSARCRRSTRRARRRAPATSGSPADDEVLRSRRAPEPTSRPRRTARRAGGRRRRAGGRGHAARAVEVGAAARRLRGDRRARPLGAAARRARRARCASASRSSRGGAESPRAAGLERDLANLEHLGASRCRDRRGSPRCPPRATWGEWIAELEGAGPDGAAAAGAVLALLAQLRGLGAGRAGVLQEVATCSATRLATVAERPPAARYGRVFVGAARAGARPRFDVVFVPGPRGARVSAEAREDPILLDALRGELGADSRSERPGAAGAPRSSGSASARPRARRTSRTRGSRSPRPGRGCRRSTRWRCSARSPADSRLPRRSSAMPRTRGEARLAWPAPDDPRAPSTRSSTTWRTSRAAPPPTRRARGRARYLLELNVASRARCARAWARWRQRFTPRGRARAAGRRHARGARRVAAERARVLRLRAPAVRGVPVPVLPVGDLPADPARGDRAARAARPGDARPPVPPGAGRGVPRAPGRGAAAAVRHAAARGARAARRTLDRVADEYREKLAPAIARVWQDEIESIRVDLRTWLDALRRGAVDVGAVRLRAGVRPAHRRGPRRAQHARRGDAGRRLAPARDRRPGRAPARRRRPPRDRPQDRHQPHDRGPRRRPRRGAPARALRPGGGAAVRPAGGRVPPVLLHAHRRVRGARRRR